MKYAPTVLSQCIPEFIGIFFHIRKVTEWIDTHAVSFKAMLNNCTKWNLKSVSEKKLHRVLVRRQPCVSSNTE